MAESDTITRVCTRCKTERTLDRFSVVRSGRQKGSIYTVCKNCRSQANAKWVAANKEKSREFSKKWRSANLEKARSISRAHAAKNRELYYERYKQWVIDNPDRRRELFNKWTAENPERYKAALKARGQRYRARQLSAEGEFTSAQIKEMHGKQKGRCPVCRDKLAAYHIDHVQALSRGGSNDISNIQLLCKPCNLRKHAKDPIQFMQEQGFLL